MEGILAGAPKAHEHTAGHHLPLGVHLQRVAGLRSSQLGLPPLRLGLHFQPGLATRCRHVHSQRQAGRAARRLGRSIALAALERRGRCNDSRSRGTPRPALLLALACTISVQLVHPLSCFSFSAGFNHWAMHEGDASRQPQQLTTTSSLDWASSM